MKSEKFLVLSHLALGFLATVMFWGGLAFFNRGAPSSPDSAWAFPLTAEEMVLLIGGFGSIMVLAAVIGGIWSHKAVSKPLSRLAHSMGNDGLQAAVEAFEEQATGAELRDVLVALQRIIDMHIQQEKLMDQHIQAQKMEAIGQLAGGVAHDFNNLLGGILGAADLLALRMEGTDDRRRFVDMITDTAQRATELTSRLLAFSRKGGDISHAVDIHDVIRVGLSSLSHSMDELDILVKTDLRADPCLITGDAAQLQTIFYHLGMNACDAMQDGGAITVNTHLVSLESAYCDASPFDLDPGRFIEISFTDTGIGMPPDVQHRIFEPFFSTKKVGKGGGLGLAVVYGTVKDHLGAVTVSSDVDKGTTFQVYLPIDVSSGTETSLITGLELPVGEGHVLVVDDEDVIRITAETMLREMGYNVVFATNGMEAMEMFKRYRNTIKVVILDLVMPVMDGHETLSQLLIIDPDVKVIISSGFACDSSTRVMLDEGAAAFLRKPFRHRDLASAVAKALIMEKSGKVGKSPQLRK